MSEKTVQPVFILSDTTQRSSGKSAQRNNILAAKVVAETVRTTLGPKGMDKMLVDANGHVTISNDGVTILEEMDIDHPAAKMVVEVARTQENEIGDGTTTAVIIAGELLKNAETMLDDKIHPTVIIKGYRIAQEQATKEIKNLAQPLKPTDTQLLESIAITAMTGKGAENAKEHLATLCVTAVRNIAESEEIDLNTIKIQTQPGASIEESTLIQGIVLDKEVVHPNMPKNITDAKILLINSSLELKETEMDAKISIQDPSQVQAYLDLEEQLINQLVKRIVATQANVVVCQKGIDDLAAYHLAKHGIMAVRRVKKSDLEKLAKATGARILTDTKDLTQEALGKAGRVSQKKIGDEPMLFIEECSNAKAVTLLLRGGTSHTLDEVERAVTDAIGDLRAALLSQEVVAGAGAVEVRIAKALEKYAKTLSGREQLAVHAYAQALLIIPRTLAENAGLDPIDVLADLQSATMDWPGIDVNTGEVVDSWSVGVIEPARIKTQALSSATDVACMILRIDDVITAHEKAN